MKKPRQTASVQKAPDQTPEALRAAAQGQVAAGRYREAIATYKDLLKVENAPETRLALAGAYAGRARELAAKGMSKEALTIWQNRAQLVPDLPPEMDYLALLLRLGQVRTVVDLYARGASRLDAAARATLGSLLAARHLGGEAAVAAGLPSDDPILVQGANASQALDAYCRGDDPALRDALAAIPFRSPYRDLAQVLKALQRASAAPAEAAELLAKVDDNSGFAPLRRACELGLSAPETLLERLAGAGDAARRFALTLAGWGEERQALWDEVRRVGDPGPQTMVRLLHRQRTRLGEDWARRQALRLLVPGFPKTAAWVAEGGGRRLSEEERLLVAAWRAEEGRNPWDIVDAWRAYARHLLRGPLPELGSEKALRVALVLRRPDRHLDILSDAIPSRDPDGLDTELARLVEASLDHDPDDRDSHERLIRYYLRGKDLKTARRLLERALARFPADLGLLTAALDIALAGDSFKKAARHAREILALDPINTGAQERLVKAHLAHARKQMRAGRLDLARKELHLAAEWDPAGRLRERRGLLGGLLDLAQDQAQGEAALREQVRGLGGGITAAFVLTLECAAIGRPAPAVLKAVGLWKVPIPGQADLPGFLARLRNHLDGGDPLPADVRRLFEGPLKAAAHSPLSLGEAEAACDTLRRAGLAEARLAFADAALKRWPRTPVFVLHAFEARYEDRDRRPPARELGHLSDACDAARAAGDQRTAHRAEEILRSYGPYGYGPRRVGRAFEDDDLDLRGLGIDPDQALRTFVEAMGLDGLLNITGASPKERAHLRQLEREVGREGVMEILLAMLRNGLPDFGPPSPGRPKGPVPAGPGGVSGKAGREPRKDDDEPEQFDLF